MGITAGYRNTCYIEWPECDTPDMKRLFEKLYKYKKKAGFKNDGLELTKRDRELIKQIFDCFDHKDEEIKIVEHSGNLTKTEEE